MRTGIVALAWVLAGCAVGVEGVSDDDAAAPESAECTLAQLGASEVCTAASGEAGARLCQQSQQGDDAAQSEGFVWSDCRPTKLCQPGQTRACTSQYGAGTDICTIIGGQWAFTSSGCSTPLVLSFDAAPITFTNPQGSFDVAGRETRVPTAWVSANTPWLVFDRNSNGTIDDGAELFGSMTRLPDGQRAKNGFAALAPFDADGDGWLTSRDPAFARLALWRDLDQDRVSSPEELSPLADSVLALSLAFAEVPRCFAGSCERERAAVVFRDRAGNEQHGSVVDVYLAER